MPHKLRKTRRKRGTRTVGWGRIGQHRKAGQKGGCGKTGRRKHLRSYAIRYEPDYFSKKGFYSPRQGEIDVINVGALEEAASKLFFGKSLDERNGMVFLNLGKMGYGKLLGKGNVAKPFSVKVMSYSKTAARKVEEAGGKIVAAKSAEN